jgi:hypothetical protein
VVLLLQTGYPSGVCIVKTMIGSRAVFYAISGVRFDFA